MRAHEASFGLEAARASAGTIDARRVPALPIALRSCWHARSRVACWQARSMSVSTRASERPLKKMMATSELAATSRLLSLVAALVAVSGADSQLVVDVTPADDIQALALKHPEGVTFRLAPGLYRSQGYVPPEWAHTGQPIGLILKNNTRLEAAVRRTAILSGSVPVNASSLGGTGLWQVQGLLLQDNSTHGVCKPEYPACNLRQDMFLHGKPLRRVLTLGNVSAGSNTWYLDYATGVATVGVTSQKVRQHPSAIRCA